MLLLIVAGLAGAGWCLTAGLAEDPAPRPVILLTNDDGVGAEGLRAIAAALGKVGEVIIAAPSRNSSGSSQSLTLSELVRVRKLATPADSGLTVHAIDGSPSTCVYLALEHLTGGRRIDLAVSGINRGQNVGLDLGFSGTVGAARTAAELGLPAIAFSLALGSVDLEAAARRAAEIVAEACERKLPPGTVICVNFPATPAAEWKRPLLTVPGGRGFRLVHELRSANGPDSIYEPQMPQTAGPYPEGSDTRAIADGHISVSVVPLVAGGGKAAPDLRDWRIFK
jgi:5'-nucleotidase